MTHQTHYKKALCTFTGKCIKIHKIQIIVIDIWFVIHNLPKFMFSKQLNSFVVTISPFK